MKRLSILGSTGSIGKNTLAVVERFPGRFTVKALAARQSVASLADQIRRFRPDLAVVHTPEIAGELERLVGAGTGVEVLHGDAGYAAAATHADVDLVVGAMVGAAGLAPTLAAIEAGKDIALANKETLVMAGQRVMGAAADRQVRIFPVDSEHSAIYQCLAGNRKKDVDRILLTGSGGPFRTMPKDRFADITVADALRHPNWRMGPKITVDSSTLMNKGLEVIEAKWLFDMPVDRIEVLIHPQSIVHSMVAFLDGSVLAQLGVPDMKTAIAYALSCPGRLPLGQPIPDFSALGHLDFEPPDLDRFPCLKLAFEACSRGGTLPAVLNAANEAAVEAFLDGRLAYLEIPEVIGQAMGGHDAVDDPTLADIRSADRWARERAGRIIDVLAAAAGKV